MRANTKKMLFNGFILLICLFTWLILIDKVTPLLILVGLSLAVLALWFNNSILHHDFEADHIQLHPFILPRYFFHLMVQIYIAGFQTIVKIINGRINPDIIEIETDLENDFYICLLANSITLTPGTVTIDKDHNKLLILWLDCETKNNLIAGDLIKGKFEQILRKG